MEWSITNDDKVLGRILGTLIEELLQTIPELPAWHDYPPYTSFADKNPDIFASSTVLNIDLEYTRIIPDRTVNDYIKIIVYTIKTKSWALTFTRPLLIDPDNIEPFIWIGSGDYEQWKHDFTLLKLFGYSNADK